MKEKHTFVICAYGESPYLEECICSLLNQKRKSSVLIATSTPNEHIERLAEKYHLQVKVKPGGKGDFRRLELCLLLCRYALCYAGPSG